MVSVFYQRASRFKLLACLVVVAALALAGAAWAMRVSPMVVELTTRGGGTSARIEVGNVGAVPLPFETAITRLVFKDDGSIEEVPAEEDFLVFPPQGLVPVNGRQMVRVQWIGNPDIDVSEAYYVAIKQLPINQTPDADEGDGQVAVQVLYNMKALVVVAPPGASPDVKVESAVPTTISVPVPPSDDGEAQPPVQAPAVNVTVRNDGKRYALMSGATWIIEGTDMSGAPYRKAWEAGSQLSSVIGVGYAAPLGGRRTFDVPTEGVVLDPSKPVTVKFTQ